MTKSSKSSLNKDVPSQKFQKSDLNTKKKIQLHDFNKEVKV